MAGTIVALDLAWYDTRILNCSYCGKMIAKHYWADDDYPDQKFCEEACVGVKRRLEAESG